MILTLALLVSLAVTALPDTPVATPVLINAPGRQTPAAIASDGRNFLVAWLDERPASGLYVARVASAGFVLDRAGIRLAPRANAAAAFWNGVQYVVVWSDGDAVFSQLITTTGTLVDTPRRLYDGVTIGSHFAAFDGSRIAIAQLRGTSVELAMLDRTASSVTRTIPSLGATLTPPTIANAGTEFLAAWTTSGGIDSVRVTDAAVQQQPRIATAGDSSRPIVASDGTGYVVVTAQQSKIFVQKFGGGAPLQAGDGSSPDIIWNGSDYLLFFTANGEIRALLVDRDGHPLGNEPALFASAKNATLTSPVAGRSDGDVYVAWSDDRVGLPSHNVDVVGRIVDSGFDTLISTAAQQEHTPAVAFGAQRFLAAWLEERPDGTNDLFIGRLTTSSARMDGRGVRLSTSGDETTSPRVVFDGKNFVIAWIAHRSGGDFVVTNRFSPDGAVLDPGGIYQFTAQGCISGLDIATDGAVPVVVWSDCATGRVFAGRVTNGGIMASAFVIAQVSPNGVIATRPSVAWNGKTFLATWEEEAAHAVRAARFTPGLNVIDTAPIDVAANAKDAAVASNGDDFLVAWETDSRIQARRISSLGALDIITTMGDGHAPSVARDGDRYLVAFESLQGDVVATHGSDLFTVVSSEFPQHDVALAPMPGGVAAVYERVAADRTYGGVYRTFFRTIVPASRHRAVGH